MIMKHPDHPTVREMKGNKYIYEKFSLSEDLKRC